MATKKSDAKKTQGESTVSVEQLVDRVKEAIHATLGVSDMIFEEASARVKSARSDASSEWTKLVQRGEAIHADFNKRVDDFDGEITFEIPLYVELDDVRNRLEEFRAKLDEQVDQFKTRIQPA